MTERHVLITGGTGGLGCKVTGLALDQGAHVVVPYIVKQEAEAVIARCAKQMDRVLLVSADLTEEDTVRRMVDGMQQIDALVHLIGGFTMGPTHELEAEAWHKWLDLNLTTAFFACKHALRRMRERGYGRIVTVSTGAAIDPPGQMAVYAAAKAGVLALTRSIAQETKGMNITANCVLPSIIDTPANRAAMGDADADKWVKPESLAEVILFLASDAARDIRGAAVPVPGNV